METKRVVGTTVPVVRVAVIAGVVTVSLVKETPTIDEDCAVIDGEIVNVKKDDMNVDDTTVGDATIVIEEKVPDGIRVVGLGVMVVVGTKEMMSRSSIRELTWLAME